MKNLLSKSVKRICLFLAAAALTVFSNALTVDAAEMKTVRVGWFQSDMFQEGMSDEEEKSGYCYDYLQKVADYTKWEYEYVYGDWTELYHMLQHGEIDFLGGVSYTEERRELMLFPDTPMGDDQYYLFKHDDDNSISASDISTLTGKKVGGIIDNRTTQFTKNWLEENNAASEMVYYESFSEQEEAFGRGELDLLAQTIYNVLRTEGISMVAKVGEEPFYLAVNKNRPDLLEELNAAMSSMISTDPFILQDMQYENYGSTLTGKTLSEEERQWLEEHSQIKVGYLENYLPYCATDKEGEAKGLMTDVLREILAVLNLSDSVTLSYRQYASYEEMTAALKQDEIDIAFPVYGNLWLLEQDGIDASSAVLSGTETLFYNDKYSQNSTNTIAVNRNNKMQIAFTDKQFPNARIVECDSIDDCLDAVLHGKADGTVINTMRTALVTNNTKYNKLSYIQLPEEEKRCFGVAPSDTELLLLLNRGLSLIGDSYGVDASYLYVGELYKYTAWDFIRSNMLIIATVIVAVLVIVVWMLYGNLKKKEENNRELEKLREAAVEADKAKTAFLFNMSHDIRTPMNAILGYSDLMQQRFDEKEVCLDYLDKIKKSGNFLLSLINDVLEMARIESGKEELNEVRCSTVQVFDEVSSVYSELMREKGITFTYTADVISDYVYADTVKLNEIFLNLLSNAYKYTMPGGSVRLELKEFPSEKEGYDRFEAIIADTGIGMTRDYLAQLFEPFSREKSVTQSKISGTGLGMPIVKKLVELMGGSISVTSNPGEGTIFFVTTLHKVADGPEENTAKSTGTVHDFVGKRILLAEDNEFNAEIAVLVLEDAGFEVDTAEDGIACIDMICGKEAGYYDLILMDIQMPNMDGYEATRTIRKMEDEERSRIPIIAMTANAFEEDKKNAMEAGMNAHLSKPIELDSFIATLTTVLFENETANGSNC